MLPMIPKRYSSYLSGEPQRHAHTSHAIDRGAPLLLVRDTLGYASIATTNKYSHARLGTSSGQYLPV